MSNVFCTLAMGERYAELAAFLMADLESYGVSSLVLTDRPEWFGDFSHTKVVEHRPKQFSYHDKRLVLQEALKLGDTAVFVDADTAIWFGADRRVVRKALHHPFPPGLHASQLMPPGYYDYPHIEAKAREWGLQFDRNVITYWEGLFAISRDENLAAFFAHWDKFAAEADARGHNGAGEGTCFGIAAEAAGIHRHYTTHMIQSHLPFLLWHTRLGYDRRKLYHWKFGFKEFLSGNFSLRQHCWSIH
jgi:hypothetical protein